MVLEKPAAWKPVRSRKVSYLQFQCMQDSYSDCNIIVNIVWALDGSELAREFANMSLKSYNVGDANSGKIYEKLAEWNRSNTTPIKELKFLA